MRNWRKKAILLAALLLLLPLWACVQSQGMGVSSQAGPSVAELRGAPASYVGQTVLVSGLFKGWKGACLSTPPVSRSDWMLEDGTGCIYVHAPLPAGSDPLKPQGEAVSLRAVVRQDRRGAPYLEGVEP
ncbi:MAG: hypothetical protein C0617_06345 [Desulfuromonas sp.]|uniref:hypothetical protein n=1 Tax=Desulfuromonas sp. TaxID=892 RepID=UPI000CA91A04|nr:hypothetical protein [Desulfuromonas sp.]PLX84830.1 MAG: hypothetical protein C0617_06345 [Desulfuromonas sp.]